MAATLLDVVTANLVLVGVGLLNQQAEIDKFTGEINSEARLELGLVANIPSGLTEPSRTLRLNRERISLELSSARSTIAREYPSPGGEDLDHLAEVAALAISCTDLTEQNLQSFGYNIETVFDQDTGQPSIRYLGERLFGPAKLGDGAWNFIGGTGSLVFGGQDGRRTFGVETRFGDQTTTRVFLRLNLHKDEQSLPSESQMKDSLRQIWREAEAFMGQLDRSGVQ